MQQLRKPISLTPSVSFRSREKSMTIISDNIKNKENLQDFFVEKVLDFSENEKNNKNINRNEVEKEKKSNLIDECFGDYKKRISYPLSDREKLYDNKEIHLSKKDFEGRFSDESYRYEIERDYSKKSSQISLFNQKVLENEYNNQIKPENIKSQIIKSDKDENFTFKSTNFGESFSLSYNFDTQISQIPLKNNSSAFQDSLQSEKSSTKPESNTIHQSTNAIPCFSSINITESLSKTSDFNVLYSPSSDNVINCLNSSNSTSRLSTGTRLTLNDSDMHIIPEEEFSQEAFNDSISQNNEKMLIDNHILQIFETPDIRNPSEFEALGYKISTLSNKSDNNLELIEKKSANSDDYS